MIAVYDWGLKGTIVNWTCHSSFFSNKGSLLIPPAIYTYTLLVCLGVRFFVSNKRQNGFTDRAQTLCGTSHDPREGLWMIKTLKISAQQNSIFINFENQ